MSSVYFATFSAKGYGTKTARCTGLSWGTNIEGTDSESRAHSTFYPQHVTDADFSVSVAFATHDLWREFNEWLEEYGRTISDPNGTVGPMLVSIPFRSFSKVALPINGFAYGDKTGDLVRRSTIIFTGANDPLKPGQKGTTSEPTLPSDPIVATFYPTGYQAGGKVEDALYNGIAPLPQQANGPATAGNHAAQNEINQRNGGPSSSAGDVPGGYD